MTTVDTTDPVIPDRWSKPLWLLADHNPFFLLSGVCMLAGCFLINAAAHQQHDRIGLLLGLLVIFNLYEFLVIGLGLYLLRKRGLVRDAGYLLMLEMLLVVDATLLYNECFTANVAIGSIVASAGLLLALGKLAAINRYAHLRLTAPAWGVIAANLITVLALPGVLRWLGEMEQLSPTTFYVLWWFAGGLLAAVAMPSRWRRNHMDDVPAEANLSRALCSAAAALPVISVIGHLRASHYIYTEPMVWAAYAPVVLGLAVLVIRFGPGRVTSATVRGTVIVAGSVAALLSLGTSDALIWTIGEWVWPTVSPMRLTLLGAALVYGWLWWRLGGWWVCAAAAGWLLVAAAGHSPTTVRGNLARLGAWCGEVGQRLLPTSVMQWGIVAVTAAFAFLIVGAAVSLVRRPATPAKNQSARTPRLESGDGVRSDG